MDDSRLPIEWSQKSDYFYGISDSLYDRNQVTRLKNGDPIADCFGIIARQDSAILAVADGVNWGKSNSNQEITKRFLFLLNSRYVCFNSIKVRNELANSWHNQHTKKIQLVRSKCP